MFLGRPWAYATETGFVGYRVSDAAIVQLLDDMRGTYASGRVFGQPNWGDAFTFDQLRERLHGGIRQRDLSGHLGKRVGLNVWPRTQLSRWLVHHKGPRRMVAEYGSST